MGDLISRRGVSAWLYNLGYAKLADTVMNEQRFPSAQSDIIRCKDCKYSDENWRRVSVKWLPCMDIRVPSNWFCGSAERREE